MTSNASNVTSLSEQVALSLQNYFTALKDESPMQLYQLVIDEMEIPLLKSVMQYTNNNQSEAAKILGISRGTLRTKLKKHFDDAYCATRK